MKKVRVVSLACDTPTGPPRHFYTTLSKYVLENQLWNEQDFGFRGDNYIKKEESELSLLHVICLLVLLLTSSKYYPFISNSTRVMACTRFWLQGRLYNEDSESCHSCM